MSDDILIGYLDGLTVGEAACPDDAVILGPSNPDEDDDDRAEQSLAEYARDP